MDVRENWSVRSNDNTLVDRLHKNKLAQLKDELESIVAKKIANRVQGYMEKVKAGEL